MFLAKLFAPYQCPDRCALGLEKSRKVFSCLLAVAEADALQCPHKVHSLGGQAGLSTRAGQGRVGSEVQDRAGQGSAEIGSAEQGRAGHGRARQCQAGQCYKGQGRAGQGQGRALAAQLS